MISPVEDALDCKMHLGVRSMVMHQWNNTRAFEAGDQVRFEQLCPLTGNKPLAHYFPKSMPVNNATGVVLKVVPHHGGAQDCVLMELPDGRVKAAPMCWLRPVVCEPVSGACQS